MLAISPGQVLLTQSVVKPSPVPFSEPGTDSGLPDVSIIVISSSGNEEMTPWDPEVTVAPDTVQEP